MWKFERAFVLAEEIDNGPLPARYLNVVFAFSFALLLISLLVHYSTFPVIPLLVGTLLAFVMARLFAIDLCYLLLPNIYVFPLIILGPLAAHFLNHIHWVESLFGLLAGLVLSTLILGLIYLLKREDDIGMGDIKFLVVLGGWVGLTNLPLALAVSCFAGLGLSFIVPRGKPFPFGPALILGLWCGVFYAPVLQNLLIKMISLIP